MRGRRISSPANTAIEAFVLQCPFVTETERPHPQAPPAEVVAFLESKKSRGETDHFGLLLEYGLRVHWRYLEHTALSREIPVESNTLLAELVRLAEIPKYMTAHEGGWLNRQFLGEFDQTGWSSYQTYVWAKEHVPDFLSDDKRFPNWDRIGKLLHTIDGSSLNGIGGKGVCHYGCV